MLSKFKISKSSLIVKSGYVAPFCYVSTLVAASNTLLYIFKFKSFKMGMICGFAALSAITVLLLKNKIHHIITSSALIMAFYVTISSLALFSGGIASFPIWWLGTIPMIATFLLNSYYGFVWYVAMLVTFLVILNLGTHGYLPANELLNIPPTGRMVVSFVFNSSLIAFLCFLADLIREKAFVESEKMKIQSLHLNQMASMGRLTSGVAHEVANPLTVVKSANARIEKMLANKEELNREALKEQLEKSQKNIARIESVVSLMQVVSDQNHNQNVVPIKINEILMSSLTLVNEQIRLNSANVEIEQSDISLEIKGVYSEILKSFTNIIENSLHSVEKKTGEKIVRIIVLTNLKSVEILVEDNGKNIAKEDIEHIFDPYFISKNAYPGRNFSLSFARNTFVSCGGALEFVTKKEEKAFFKVTLPLSS